MRKQRYGTLLIGILLIGIGTLLLLEMLGVARIPWATIWRLWPLLLVLLGLELILARSRLGAIVGLAIGVIIVVGVLALLSRLGGPAREAPQALSYPLSPQVELARLHLTGGVGRLEVSRLATADALYRTEFLSRSAGERLNARVTVHRNIADVRMNIEDLTLGIAPWGTAQDWRLWLNPEIPFELSANTGVGEVTFDLRGMLLSDLRVNAGVGRVTVILSERGSYSARLDGGVGDLEVIVPSEVPVLVRIDQGLGTVKVDPDLRRLGESFATERYEPEKPAIEIFIDGGVGGISVRQQ